MPAHISRPPSLPAGNSRLPEMAKLYDFGEGILRTHLTWDDLQEKVKEVFGEKAIFGPNREATSIGDGRGFMSKMCLINPDWQLEPKKFVVKISSQIALTEANEKMRAQMPEITPEMEGMAKQMQEALDKSVRRIHNVEINMYSLIKKYNISVSHAKTFVTVPFTEENTTKGYIIMEYVEGALNLNIYDNVSVEDIKLPLRGIAALEAASARFTEEEKSQLSFNPFTEILEGMMSPQTIPAMISILRRFAGNVMGEKIDKFETMVKDIMDPHVVKTIATELDIKEVLVHGDLWSTNLLWTKREGTELLDLVAVVDYQTSHMGMPASDLVRLMGACLSGKDRQAHWEELTETFYGYLKEEMKGEPAPYTLEQLKESFRRYLPMGGFMLVPMIGPIFQMNACNPDPEAKKKIEDRVLEKTECLLDDMMAFHERNQSLKKTETEEALD